MAAHGGALKIHALWGALVVVALIALVVMERRAGAAMERMARLQDSLTTVGARLDSLTSTALAHVARDTALERQRLAALAQARQDAQNRAQRALGDAAVLRARLVDSVRAAFDALQGTQARLQALLEAQRDSAIALFRGAAASRDTLAALLAESQAQRRSLMTALIEARKRPVWDKPVIRWGSLAAAYLLGKL